LIESTGTMKQLPRPLDGIRIVECGVWHAGPGAAAILADLGAEVIKIETFTGDPERHFGSFGPMDTGRKDKPDWTLLFEFSNRNKKGICVDTATKEGKVILHELVKSADIFVTNLRQSSKPKLGIDYQSLAKINPKIIHLNVSGFGPKGAMSNDGGFDPMGQAVSGMMFMTGADEPILLQTIVLDQLTAITASHAALTGLFFRERHNIGQEIHVSLYGSAVWMLHANLLTTSMLKQNIQVKWDRLNNPALRNSFKCKDGKWIMGTNHPDSKYWPTFCGTIGQSQLINDPRFATSEQRKANNPELIALLDEVLQTKDRVEWLQLFQKHGLLFAPVQELEEVLEDPQALVNGYVVDYDHPSLGTIRIPGYPASFSANTAGIHGPAPDLGQHTAPILMKLGYTNAAVEQLKAANVVR
jgi:crotonobetainyl-CoA:carnitine CoA-transferase CaiB-like acyl-CoA transferase